MTSDFLAHGKKNDNSRRKWENAFTLVEELYVRNETHLRLCTFERMENC